LIVVRQQTVQYIYGAAGTKVEGPHQITLASFAVDVSTESSTKDANQVH